MRDNDMPSETHNGAASGSASDGCLGNDFTPREKLPETGTTLDCSDRKGDPISTQWDGRYERGYGELMERDCERERYQAIGQIVATLPAHSSLLDVGCGVGTMADYLPALDYTGVDVSQKALAIARSRHLGTFICSDAVSFRIDKKFDVILFNETLYYLEEVFRERGCASVRTITLLDKPERRVVDLKVDYTGFEIPDQFVVGYGMDYDQRYRDLPFIGVVEFEVE